jgi:hypothetical protein
MNVWNQLICLTVCYPLAFSLVRSSRYNIINKKLEWLSALLSHSHSLVLSLSLLLSCLKAPFHLTNNVRSLDEKFMSQLIAFSTHTHTQVRRGFYSTVATLCLFHVSRRLAVCVSFE